MKLQRKITPIAKTGDDVSVQLTNILSDLFASRMKSQVYHWNFVGSNFFGVHKLLEDFYEHWDEYIDDTAERLRMLDARPPSSLKEIDSFSSVENSATDKHIPPEAMLQDMIDTLEALRTRLVNTIKAADKVDDFATADLLTKILAKAEKYKWMFESVAR